MSNISILRPMLPASSASSIEKVRELDRHLAKMPQYEFVTEHMLHGGMYTRSFIMPAGVVGAAVLIKVPTVLIVAGDADIFNNDVLTRVQGYNVLAGSAGRKIAFYTHSIMGMSMMFPCDAETVDEAQKQFTDEWELLVPLSEEHRHRTLITGE